MLIREARSFRDRLLGFMFQNPEGRGGIHFPDCRAVHTSFVLGTLDILFLDAKNKVVRAAEKTRPFRILWSGEAASVLELPGGRWARLSGREKATLLSSLPLPSSR